MSEPVTSLRKETIIRTAAQLFREKGYAATSMRELAQAVGLEASSLYSHISSKVDLLDLICFQAADRFTKGMADIRTRSTDPLDQIRALIRLHVHIALDDPTSQTVFSDEWRHLPADRLEAFLALRRDYEKQFLDIIHSAQAAGRLRPVPPKVILLTLLSSLGWLYREASSLKAPDHTRLANQLCDLLLNGIRQS